MRLSVMLVGLAACGRIGFDPSGEGSGGDGGNGSGVAGESCTSPGVLVIGQPLNNQSLAGATNDVTPGGPCPNGIDVVYAVTSATSGLRSLLVSADFGGAIVTAQNCPPLGLSCNGLIANDPLNAMTSIPAGTTYVIVEKTSGAGTTFSISLQ